MTEAISIPAEFACAGALSFALTPLAIRVARRTGFLDHPREYRQHARPTPLLGGSAVLLSFLAVSVLIGGIDAKLLVALGGGVAMFLLGTLDDRIPVAPKWRVLAATLAAVGLFLVGLGWDTGAGTAVNVVLTVVWTVGLVNAFNLMDNLDGACSTVAATAAAGIGTLAVVKGDTTVAALSFALSGACVGFLPWNLAGPARAFLGDGGSMPLGFLIAALAMTTARHDLSGNAGILVGALLVGLPILDVALVSFSRFRRGTSLMTGGRDHLTHRVLLAVGSSRRVALAMAVAQALLCSLALIGYELGIGSVIGLAFAAFVAGAISIVALDTARWRPPGIAVETEPLPVPVPVPVPGEASAAATLIGVDAG